MDVKRGIKHDVSQYSALKDEKYFDQFQMAILPKLKHMTLIQTTSQALQMTKLSSLRNRSLPLLS